MKIIISLDVVLAKRKMRPTELAEKLDYTGQFIHPKNGKGQSHSIFDLEAICKILECQPGNIMGICK